MSQAPVSNRASHDILPENSAQALEISQCAYEASIAWGNASNLQPKREKIPGADEDILGIKLPKISNINDNVNDNINDYVPSNDASYYLSVPGGNCHQPRIFECTKSEYTDVDVCDELSKSYLMSMSSEKAEYLKDVMQTFINQLSGYTPLHSSR
jgi:hypothetical protein cdiviTM7_00890